MTQLHLTTVSTEAEMGHAVKLLLSKLPMKQAVPPVAVRGFHLVRANDVLMAFCHCRHLCAGMYTTCHNSHQARPQVHASPAFAHCIQQHPGQICIDASMIVDVGSVYLQGVHFVQ